MSNGVPISELTPADHLYDGCCFPIVQYDETMKVEYHTFVEQLQNDLGIVNGNWSSEAVDTGLKTADGKTIWRTYIETTVGNAQNALNALGAYKVYSFQGWALSDYGNWFPIPCSFNDARYNIYLFKANLATTFGLTFNQFYNAANAVNMVIEYTKEV